MISKPNAQSAPAPWELDDRRLLAECDCHTYRASGPGGQKRNVTESAVRLRHRPTGIAAVGTESRSQAENRRRALRRLRLALAVAIRRPVPAGPGPGSEARLSGNEAQAGAPLVSPKHPGYPGAVAAILDLLEDREGRIAEVAGRLDVPTSRLVRFLKREPIVWTEANRTRARHDLPPLK